MSQTSIVEERIEKTRTAFSAADLSVDISQGVRMPILGILDNLIDFKGHTPSVKATITPIPRLWRAPENVIARCPRFPPVEETDIGLFVDHVEYRLAATRVSDDSIFRNQSTYRHLIRCSAATISVAGRITAAKGNMSRRTQWANLA